MEDARCHIGLSSNCQAKPNWIGESTIPPPPPPLAATRKRGFSGFLGNEFTCGDASVLNLSDSWFYTWMHEPSQYQKCKNQPQAREFAPMLIGLGASAQLTGDWQKVWMDANAHYLLGYNEPDTGNGHNHPHMCTPAEAAKDWVNVQAVAEMFNPPLTLVSPAVSSSGNDTMNAFGVSPWLDWFFANCSQISGCDPDRIKHIAFHDYTGNVTEILQRAEGAHKYYNRTVWITELAVGHWQTPHGPSRDTQDQYIQKVLPALDAHPSVFRYAWFTAHNLSDFVGASSLLPFNSSSLVPTSTGKIYAVQIN